VDAIFREWESVQSTLIVLPTGCGKTTVFSEVAKRVVARGQRVMVLAHREELIFQASQRLYGFGIDTEIEMGDMRAAEWRKPQAIVSTIQTQCAGETGRMTRFDPYEFGLVIVDEAHHGVGNSYRRTLNHYKQNP
jgi:superfamily II DNA or RNA helicase